MNLSQVGRVGLHCGNTVQDSDVVTTDNCSEVIHGPSNCATSDDPERPSRWFTSCKQGYFSVCYYTKCVLL